MKAGKEVFFEGMSDKARAFSNSVNRPAKSRHFIKKTLLLDAIKIEVCSNKTTIKPNIAETKMPQKHDHIPMPKLNFGTIISIQRYIANNGTKHTARVALKLIFL